MLKRPAGTVLLVLIGLGGAGLSVEIGLRIGGVEYPSFAMPDEYRGVALRPGAEGWRRGEGAASYIRINSAGLRDREHARAKLGNTLRIAVLGDSMTVAEQVPLEATFSAVMERQLASCETLAGRQVEAINFGVNGYGTAQELLTLRHRVWDYHPDIVLLAFFTGNDIRNNSPILEEDHIRPFFVFRDGALVLDVSFRESAYFRSRQWLPFRFMYRIINYSRALQVINEARFGLSRLKLGWQQGPAPGERPMEPGLDDMVYRAPADPAWADAWRVTEALLLLMRDDAMQQGSDFLVVTLSNSIQVHPDPQVRAAFMQRMGIDHLLYPDLRIKTLCERAGIPVLSLAEPLQMDAEKHQVFLHGFANTALGEGHWNVNGHNLAGTMIARKLCQELIPRSLSREEGVLPSGTGAWPPGGGG